MIGEPEKPGPTPVASTAAPETRTSSLAPPAAGSSAITSRTSALNEEISVPCTTDRAVQTMPARTSESGMIGSAARAAPAKLSTAAKARTAHRCKVGERSRDRGPRTFPPTDEDEGDAL